MRVESREQEGAGSRPLPSGPRLSTLDSRLLLSGFLFGLAFLMKQHGLFFGVFGGLYLLRVRVGEWLAAAGVVLVGRSIVAARYEPSAATSP